MEPANWGTARARWREPESCDCWKAGADWRQVEPHAPWGIAFDGDTKPAPCSDSHLLETVRLLDDISEADLRPAQINESFSCDATRRCLPT